MLGGRKRRLTVIPASESISALEQIDGADAGLLSLEIDELTVHASLPGPWLREAAARGESNIIAAWFGFGPGEVGGDFRGYYRVAPPASASALRRLARYVPCPGSRGRLAWFPGGLTRPSTELAAPEERAVKARRVVDQVTTGRGPIGSVWRGVLWLRVVPGARRGGVTAAVRRGVCRAGG